MKKTQGRVGWLGRTVIGLGAAGMLLAGCVSTGGDSFEDFKSALDSGAPCSELYDQRSNFENEKTLDRIDEALGEIGCDDADSQRNDE